MRLELDPDLDLSLSIYRHIGLRVLIGDLTKGTIRHIVVRTVKLRAVEQVEVVELQDSLEALSQEEVLPDVRILGVEGRVAHRSIRSRRVTQHELRCFLKTAGTVGAAVELAG